MPEKKNYIAHIRKNGETHSCSDHCRNTAEYAKNNLSGVDLGEIAYLSGLLHDCGKYSDEFQEYIRKAAAREKVKKGSVIHTFAGVSQILSDYHEKESDPYRKLCAEQIAYAAGAHHGLFDCINENGENGFEHRKNKQPETDAESIKRFLDDGNRIDMEKAEKEFRDVFNIIKDMSGRRPDHASMYNGLLARLVTSAVIDGDRRDTAEFLTGRKTDEIRSGNEEIWKKELKKLEEMLDRFPNKTSVQTARRALSDLCRNAGDVPSGVYRLNLPTGSGKTLSGLRFALAHAISSGKKRILYAAPFLSILDQNGKVIREALDNDGIVLEHHSNVVPDDTDEIRKRYAFFAETWNAPVIITTLVQFLDTLFSGKTSCIRRFQALCSSVILIDEVQSIPENMVTLFNLAVNFLSRVCRATVLLCTATQPGFENADHAVLINGDIIEKKEYDRYVPEFKRTEVVYKGNYRFSEIPAFVQEIEKKHSSVLVVCNKKREARDLYKDLKMSETHHCYHLSASMCAAHRKKIIREMSQKLKENQKVICVSTQVIEAGVDISFASVVRFLAGMDNVVQAAGRCNRNGESEKPGIVYVVNCTDESLKTLPWIETQKAASIEFLSLHHEKPGEYDYDPASGTAIDCYYQILRRKTEREYQDMYIESRSVSVYDLLAENRCFAEFSRGSGKYGLRQAFKTAGDMFSVYDGAAYAVAVPYGDGERIANKLEKTDDPEEKKELIRKLNDYTVPCYEYQYKELMRQNAVKTISDGMVLAVNPEYYRKDTGLYQE